MKPLRLPAYALLLALLPVAACSRGGPAAELSVTVDSIGDTVLVRNVTGSLLGDMRLVPEVRIGTLEGKDEEMFGTISGLAVAADGTIYVYDSQVPALRAYDAEGRFLRTIGRRGGGPGEYENSDGGMAVLSDGHIVLRDPGNARFTVYSPEGEPIRSWPGLGGFMTSAPLVADRQDRLHTMLIRAPTEGERPTPGMPWIVRILRMDSEGTPLDTLGIPDFGYESPTIHATRAGGTAMNNVPFTPSHSWSVRRDGSVVVGIGDRYAIFAFRPDDTVLRVERQAERVPVSSAERDDARERATFNMRRMDPGWRWNGPPVPDAKPPYSRVFGAQDDRIWALVPQPAETIEWTAEDHERARDASRPPPYRFREPVAFDVFEPDGRYVGRVYAPRGFATHPAPIFRGDHVWAVVRDELDVSHVVRFRLGDRGSRSAR